jgi:hypothetical protein
MVSRALVRRSLGLKYVDDSRSRYLYKSYHILYEPEVNNNCLFYILGLAVMRLPILASPSLVNKLIVWQNPLLLEAKVTS